MIEMIESTSTSAVGFRLTGKLHDDDYQLFVPHLDRAIQEQGKLRLLVQFHEFEGWDLHALWDDIKFATTHCTKFERIAMVGDSKWEEWMAKICKPFTMAKIKYFETADIEKAWAWVDEVA